MEEAWSRADGNLGRRSLDLPDLAGRAGRAASVAAVIVAVASYGGVYPVPFLAAFLLASLALALALVVPVRSSRLWGVQRTAFLVALCLGAYVALQAVPLPQGAGHPIWETAGRILGFDASYLSVEPGTTLRAMPALLLPFVVFLAVSMLFADDRRAFGLWQILAGLGGAAAVFAIVEFTLFPGSLLFGAKEHYLDSLTAPFVNRNTAATFFGLSAILIAGVMLRAWQQTDGPDTTVSGREGGTGSAARLRLALWSLALLAVLTALVLTRSRAGIASSAAALAVFAAGTVYVGLSGRVSRKLRVTIAVAALGALLVVLGLLAERAALRAETQGLTNTRWCVFEFTAAAARERPLLGYGFGTFESVFPSFRLGECLPYGVWTKAHNVFLEGYLGLGLPFVVFACVVIFVLLRAYRAGFRERRRYRFAPIAGISMLLLVVLHSMLDFSIQIPGLAVFFSAATASCVAIGLGRRSRAA